MKTKIPHLILFLALTLSTTGCNLPLAAPTPTPTLPPPTPVPTATPLPTIPAPTSQPTATPLPPPQVISPENASLLTFNRVLGIGSLLKLQVSPDGAAVLMAYSTRLVLLNMADLTPLWQTDPGMQLLDVTYSQDGKLIMGLAVGGSVKAWDAASGALAAEPITQRGSMAAASLSPHGYWLAYADFSGMTHVLYAASGELRVINNGQAYPGGLKQLVLSPDEQTLLMTGLDSIPHLRAQEWSLTDGKFKNGLVGIPAEMIDWRYSVDGTHLYGINPQSVTSEPSTQLLAWSTITGQLEKAYPKNYLISDYLPSPDGKSILIAAPGGALKLIDAGDGSELAAFNGHSANVIGMAYAPDGQSVVSLDLSGKLIHWDAAKRETILEMAGSPAAAPETPAFAAAADRALLLSPDHQKLAVLDMASLQTDKTLGEGAFHYSVLAFSSVGTYAAALDEYGDIHLWNAAGGTEERVIQTVTRAPIRALKFSPDEKYLASLSDQQVLVWDLSSGLKLRDVTGMNAFDFSPDAGLVASDGPGRKVYVSDPFKGVIKVNLPANEIGAMAYSPDGSRLTIASRRADPGQEGGFVNYIYQIDAATNQKTGLEMASSPALVTELAYSPSGQVLASADGQGNIILWNLRDGSELTRFEEVSAAPIHLRFSTDGTLLYVGGGDGTIAVLATTALPAR